MTSVVQTQTINSPAFMLKERSGEPIASAFTAVNGHSSPTTPHRLNGTSGMPADTTHMRSLPPAQADKVQDQKVPPPGRDEWTSRPRPTENGMHNGNPSVSPQLDDRHNSPVSPIKRKRSTSAEDDHNSPMSAHGQARPRLDSYVSTVRDPSPHIVSQAQPDAMDHSQPRTLPPLERPEHERSWSSRDPSTISPNSYLDGQNRDYHNHEAAHDGTNPHPGPSPQANGAMDPQHHLERSSTMEITRSGVQVDPKKRKRQFANRTKTGCGTCRRRKKKCDETKPECNNCGRGGFFCEGYQPKVPWPKNGVNKPHPPAIQSKDRYPEGVQLYHSHGTRQDSYPDPNPSQTDGARARPIVVEEQDRPAPQRNGWSNYNEPRPSYPPEHSQAPEYAHPPQPASHPVPPPNEHHAPHPAQGPPPPRPHSQRIYHHTPQSMSQVVSTSPVVTTEALPHHPTQPPTHQVPPGPPGPPPAHYPRPPPPPRLRNEKEKMLSGEPFQPYSTQLIEERFHCKKRLHQFHTTSNPANHISLDSRLGIFRAIAELRYRTPDQPIDGHVGSEVFVETPFNCDYGYNLDIGDMVVIGSDCKFLDSARITIGRNTRIGPNVTIDTQKVPTNSKSLKGSRGTVVAAEVVIGENVYIGANVTILAGVKIGTGAIIHPGAVVVRDVPRDCVARGNPAEIRSVNWDE